MYKIKSITLTILLLFSILSPFFIQSAPAVGNYIMTYAAGFDSGDGGPMCMLDNYTFIADGIGTFKVYTLTDGDTATLVDSDNTFVDGSFYGTQGITGRKVGGVYQIFIMDKNHGLVAYTFDGTDLTHQDTNDSQGFNNNGWLSCNDTYIFSTYLENPGNLSAWTFDGTDLTLVTSKSGNWYANACNNTHIAVYNVTSSCLEIHTFDGATFTLVDDHSGDTQQNGNTMTMTDDYLFLWDNFKAYVYTLSAGTISRVDVGNVWCKGRWFASNGEECEIFAGSYDEDDLIYGTFNGTTFSLVQTIEDFTPGSEPRCVSVNYSSGLVCLHIQNGVSKFYVLSEPSLPEQSSPSPSDGASDQSRNPQLAITISHDDGTSMNVTFLTNATGTWGTIGTNSTVGNGTYRQTNTSMSAYNTTYFWSANVTDGTYWSNETYYFVTGLAPNWTGPAEGWDISETHSCSSTGYLYGNWSNSEHMASGALEEGWTFTNSTAWSVTDESSWWAGEYTLTLDMEDQNLSFAVCNNSGTNRSQSVGWIHTNASVPATFYWFIIFAYNNSKDFDCVLYAANNIYLAHWNGSDLIDINTGLPFASLGSWYVYQETPNEGAPYPSGCYWKLIYNSLSGRVQFKHWDAPFMSEPIGWEVDATHANITHSTCRCHGFGVYNTQSYTQNVHFDLYNLWQLNYTVNTSAYCDINDYNESRPHMTFPVIDVADILTFLEFYNDSYSGNITADIARSVMRDNVTNPMSMESRSFDIATPEADQQNDTVYYYSCLLDNYTAIDPESSYDEFLHLHIQMPPEYQIDAPNEYGDLLIGIDVDNDHAWSTNDRVYWAYANSAYTVTSIAYNGDGDPITPIYSASIWQSDNNAPGNLHRYLSTLNYAINIPLADLVKSDGYPLNSSDVFGLNIISGISDNGLMGAPACVWQNWNETSDSPYLEEDSLESMLDYFFTTSIQTEGYLANSTTLSRWGEGEIGSGLDSSGTLFYNMSIESTFNDTASTTETYVLANWTIYVNNTGTGNLNNISLNLTWWNCSCSDLDMTFVSSNQATSNFTWYNDSCYVLLENTSINPLAQGESWTIYILMNITNCSGVDSATETTTIVGNATELSEEVSCSSPPSFGWGLATIYIRVRATVGSIGLMDLWIKIISIVGFLIVAALLFFIFKAIPKDM